MKQQSITKGIIVIFIANAINLIFSICTSFVLPKCLSVNSYASLKTYQLYMTYVGICHFGFVDGIYLKYGGKSINSIEVNELVDDISTLKVFQIFISIVGIVLSRVVKNDILTCVSIMVLPTNMLTFYKYLYQASGEFKKYSNIINLSTISTFIINMCLVFIVKTDFYLYYLFGYIVLNLFIYLYIDISFKTVKNIYVCNLRFSVVELFNEIKSGILLTLGNFSSAIMTTLDRWFVKIFIGNIAFAYYAFSVSMESFLNAMLTPISITLYNAFCTNYSSKRIEKYRKTVVVTGATVVSVAFPVKFLIEQWLCKYREAISLIFLLFTAQMFYIVIKAIYVNLYKITKKQNKYFKKLCITLCIGFISNIIVLEIVNIKEGYAISTIITAVVWLLIVQIDFREEKMENNEIVYLLLESLLFIFCGIVLNAVVGFIIYILGTFLLCYIFMRNIVIDIAKVIRDYLKTSMVNR